jgi:hypothetical protein
MLKKLKELFLLTIFLMVLVLQGCATYRDTLNKWVGHSIDEFILLGGSPTKVYTLSNGDKIFEFNKSEVVEYTITEPVTTYGSVGGHPVSSTTYVPKTKYRKIYCNTTLIVDGKTNVIKGWRYEGTNCW